MANPQGANRKPILRVALLAGIAAVWLADSAAAIAADPLRGYPAAAPPAFFPFCIDMPDAKKRTLDQQAEMLKELGYEGVGHIWLDNVDKRLASLDAKGLKLYQITMSVNMAPGKEPYDDRKFTEVLSLIKAHPSSAGGVQFCVIMNGRKPSDLAGDARAVEILRKMSDEARESGADLLLYPHANNWLERIEDAVRVADKVDRPNVNVMFNVCHWLRVDKSRDYARPLKLAMPRLHAVSICGADVTKKNPVWTKDYILPLDQGTFDIAAFLKTLNTLGYRGPIGLQCYGIGGDAKVHLAHSMAAWRKLTAAQSAGKSASCPTGWAFLWHRAASSSRNWFCSTNIR